MSALARLLINDGEEVRGADSSIFYFTQENLNCQIDEFKDVVYDDSFFYIIGNAYINSNVHKMIKKRKLKYYLYPSFINEYAKNYTLICVSGSHGKTSTCTFLRQMMECKYIVGDGEGGGKGNYLVLEACEYKRVFLNYNPDVLLILNIDFDHPDYYLDEEDYFNAFLSLSKKSKFVITNGDDEFCKRIPSYRYGTLKGNDYIFDIEEMKKSFPFSGNHYIYDYVGALCVLKYLNIKPKNITFLPKRRMETLMLTKGIIIADYAHHPSEINCVYLSIIEKFPHKKIICVFEPHTISRTKKFLSKFKESLSLFDQTFLLPIYTSVRENENSIEENNLYEYLNYPLIKQDEIEKLISLNCVLLLLGAGNIYNIFLNIKQKWLKR